MCCQWMAAARCALRRNDRRLTQDRNQYTFYPGTQSVPFNAGPHLLNRTHSITADVEIPEGGAEGALVSFGGTDGGYSLYIQDGKLQYVQNYVAKEYLHVSSTETVPAGRHDLRFEFEATGSRILPTARDHPAAPSSTLTTGWWGRRTSRSPLR